MSKGPERKLAAIVSMDVVGYSRLMEADEARTLAALRAHRSELIDGMIAAQGGRIVKTMGDGLLLEFPSVVNAVNCAIEVQDGMAARNLGVGDDKRIEFRIGINLGDIVSEDGDIYGDGVNVAARLQEASAAGGIALSGVAYESLGSLIDASFEDAGTQQFKNISRPIQLWRWLRSTPEASSKPGIIREAPPQAEKPSVAVLPFENMSGESEQEYFSDGLTEDIITALYRWRSFPVIARNSTFVYKGKRVDVKQAASELGARYLLEGSVRRGAGRVRITAQLIDGLSGHHIWVEKYDRDLADIFDVQDEIVQRITAIVAPELARAEVKRSTAKRPEDLDAWDYCLRGMALIHERSLKANREARQMFNEAIAIQHDYSDAHAGLAMSLNGDILLGGTEDRMATAALSMQAARTALQYDEASSLAHHELSTAYQWRNRPDDALAEAKMAVELNPNDAEALHALGNKSNLAGDPDGISFMEKAQKLNPTDSKLHTHLTFLARAKLTAGDHDEAIDRVRQAIRRRPEFAPGILSARDHPRPDRPHRRGRERIAKVP